MKECELSLCPLNDELRLEMRSHDKVHLLRINSTILSDLYYIKQKEV